MSLRSFSDPIPQPDVSRGALPQLPVPASAPPTSNFPLGSILAPQALAPQIAIPYFGPHPADLSTVPMAIPIHGFWPATPGYPGVSSAGGPSVVREAITSITLTTLAVSRMPARVTTT